MTTRRFDAHFEDGFLYITEVWDFSSMIIATLDYSGIVGTPFNLDRALAANGFERTGDWETTLWGLKTTAKEA